ncbi:uncharacterized protein LY89DRAFT_735621 [Mollisia scopiformis]|uniref:2EXR domain-containing protein n=1 Tax=Mollisia scopiformis TaxID=149040 RepID=A0A194X5R1_MOLSC|nr:uncharacterized protein LY89DRAFT_735621 [Mollisia scopiformis]KUJ15520.1 hypothetical protein LY89DRAFT_735621 [Mollisia scopiformis]
MIDLFRGMTWYELIAFCTLGYFREIPRRIRQKCHRAFGKHYDLLCDNYESMRESLEKFSRVMPQFPRFQELPAEIRCLIWNYATPEARVVEMRLKQSKGNKVSFRSICQIPAILHTCQESRAIGLQTYHLAFRTSSSPAMTFVDFERDIIYFGAKAIFQSYKPIISRSKEWWDEEGFSDFENIRRIGLGSTSSPFYEGPNLEELRGVKEIIMVARMEYGSHRKWDLGRNPKLVRFGIFLHDANAVVAWRRIMDRSPKGRPMANASLECFVKAPGDRWWFKGNGVPF